MFPILVFVGLEITAQSFHATPRRHYPAVALACVPALAYLALIAAEPGACPELGSRSPSLRPQTQHWVADADDALGRVHRRPACSGRRPWPDLIDGRVRGRRGPPSLAGVLALFGVIHSPLPSSPILLPARRSPAGGRGSMPRRSAPDALSLGRGLRRDGRRLLARSRLVGTRGRPTSRRRQRLGPLDAADAALLRVAAAARA